MIILLSEIHFWTTQEDVIIKHTDYGSFKYYTKKEGTSSLASQSKKQYCELRGVIWSPVNKRPQKLRDRLKELDEYLIHNKIVSFVWDDNKLKLLLSTGLLVYLTLNSKTGDVIEIVFDRQLATKLQVNIICDGTIIDNQVICICNDGHVFGFGGQWKDGWVLEGGPRRKLNYYGEWLAVWGKAGAEHPQPWSPLAKDHQRANLHLYWLGARGPELLSYKKTDGEPLQVVVSKICSRTLIVVEQKVTQRGAVSVEVSNFELVGNHLKRISVTSVPLQTQISCSSLNKSENRLLICCIDGSLALLDRNRGSTRTVKAAFIPTFAVWHPDGVIVAVSNERGQLQYYDTALNCIKSEILGEDCTPTAIIDLSSYFNMQFNVASIDWSARNLIFSLEQGPIAVITHVERSLNFKAVTQKYLNLGKLDKAIKLLLSWDFDEEAFCALQRIVAYILRLPLTEELSRHLQNALGSFHSSPVPLRPQIKHRYGGQVFSLTRRFFHQLVRANLFETAFLLAVDVGHHDLFMDLFYIAVKIGEKEMAAAARAQASALLSRCSSEASNCSRSSCSQCSDTGSTSSEEFNSSNDQKEQKTLTKTDYPPLPLNSHNLSMNFGTPSFKVTIEKEVPQHFDYSRLSCTPRATYVKAPQVPSTFTKVNPLSTSNLAAPSPSYTPPLPNLSSNSLGIPYMQGSTVFNGNFPNSAFASQPQKKFQPHNFCSSPMSTNSFLSGSLSNINLSPRVPPNTTLYSAFSSSNLTVNNIKKSFTSINKIQAPPLPNLSTNNYTDSVILSSNLNPSYVSDTATSNPLPATSESSSFKKPPPKVKFSDTVTAFIVPEIKRPQRQPPPSHVTNPQKELADSLPLCHPNEDYLKDFTPVRKDDTDDQESDSGQQAKIKVVHFGVV